MKHQDPALAKLSLSNPVHFLALGFGTGLVPKAPGTFGTLAAFPLYYLMMDLPLLTFALITLLITVIGFWICDKAASDMQVHDHGAIVWDEVAGMLITLIAAPVSWTAVIVGFAIFRLFDIFKPWPISFVDKNLHGGLGIMVDDVLAGLAALACMYFIF